MIKSKRNVAARHYRSFVQQFIWLASHYSLGVMVLLWLHTVFTLLHLIFWRSFTRYLKKIKHKINNVNNEGIIYQIFLLISGILLAINCDKRMC